MKGKEVSFTAKMLTAIGGGWITEICEEEGLSVWTGIDSFSNEGEHRHLVTDYSEWQDINILFIGQN
jgi:hypothetical protein